MNACFYRRGPPRGVGRLKRFRSAYVYVQSLPALQAFFLRWRRLAGGGGGGGKESMPRQAPEIFITLTAIGVYFNWSKYTIDVFYATPAWEHTNVDIKRTILEQ